MTSYAGRALDCEADGDRIARLGCNVDVLAGDIGRAVVVELQEVYLVGNHGSWYHDGGKERERGPRGDSSLSSTRLPRGGWCWGIQVWRRAVAIVTAKWIGGGRGAAGPSFRSQSGGSDDATLIETDGEEIKVVRKRFEDRRITDKGKGEKSL